MSDELKKALAVPVVWTREESSGLAKAYSDASKEHGHYESLYAAAVWLLRHRQKLAGVYEEMEAERDEAVSKWIQAGEDPTPTPPISGE